MPLWTAPLPAQRASRSPSQGSSALGQQHHNNPFGPTGQQFLKHPLSQSLIPNPQSQIMREFFHGWRRKAGVVTLVIACAVTGMWVRSNSMDDEIFFSIGNRRHRFRSADSQFSWAAWPEQGWTHFHRASGRIEDRELELETPPWALYATREMPPNSIIQWAIPYWYATTPPTLLSAILILWKPRKRKTSDQPTNQSVIPS